MTYIPFNMTTLDPTTQNGTAFAQGAIDNMEALRDMCVMGTAFGWNCTPSGGTSDYPTTWLRTKGVEQIKSVVTYGTSGGEDGNITTITYTYSSNSGSTFSTIGTLTLSYNSSGDYTGSVWS